MTGDRRVALVTGASRGIGRAVTLALADAGLSTGISYRRDSAAADDVVREVRSRGPRAIAYPGSIDDPEHVAGLVDDVIEDFGRLDVLVHAAGIASRGNDVATTEASELSRVMGVHAFAAHQLARHSVRAMRRRGVGHIVFISSTISTSPRPGTAPYVMAKAAIDALGLTLAMEERPNGIRVNVVAPGLVATDMGDRLVQATQGRGSARELDEVAPFGRVCRPEDIASCVAFLVSTEAEYITGQRIVVDGGESWGWWGPEPSGKRL